ncbi:MAG: signal peptidase II [Corynebacterium sp.]|nr:signal peptidase II [Corynebacterium sp.]
MAGIIIIVAIVDQLTKIAILGSMAPGEIRPLIGDWFRFYLVFNSGAAFSMGAGFTWVFTLIQLAFVIVIAIYSPRITDTWSAVALALVAGGAAGNLIDRLFRAPGFFIGHVVDFISVGSFAIFNIADSCITIGVCLLIINLLGVKKNA